MAAALWLMLYIVAPWLLVSCEHESADCKVICFHDCQIALANILLSSILYGELAGKMLILGVFIYQG